MTFPISAVMIHVAEPERALAWYQQVFPQALAKTVPENGFSYLLYQGVQLEFVPADDQVSSGASGSVVYWHVDDFATFLEHALSLGATLYRGPLTLEQGIQMCQVRDLWGNCIGLRGT